jgi:hypothetical protein
MDKSRIQKRYFDWMCDLVCNDKYTKLLRRLNAIDFSYTIERDGNRAEDGVDLRYRFGNDRNIDDRVIATCLDDHTSSVLEVMVALSLRCEEIIHGNVKDHEPLAELFWTMIENLGLSNMTDDNFNIGYVDECISVFLDHEYAYNGEGGLFVVKDPPTDMRKVELWYQMHWYLNEIL